MFYAKTFFDLTIYCMTEKCHGIYFDKTELKNINQRSVLGSAELAIRTPNNPRPIMMIKSVGSNLKSTHFESLISYSCHCVLFMPPWER